VVAPFAALVLGVVFKVAMDAAKKKADYRFCFSDAATSPYRGGRLSRSAG